VLIFRLGHTQRKTDQNVHAEDPVEKRLGTTNRRQKVNGWSYAAHKYDALLDSPVTIYPIHVDQGWLNFSTQGPISRLPGRWRAGCSAIYVTGSSWCCCTAVHSRKRGTWNKCAKHLPGRIKLVSCQMRLAVCLATLDVDWRDAVTAYNLVGVQH